VKPELQNIPVGSPEGKRLREMFQEVPIRLLSIDYGALERRIYEQMMKKTAPR
jgi:DNA polymerase I-like protein with 3'-5' exonuclease and polymerase domains